MDSTGICVCSDLSQGVEPKKLPVIRINHDDGATTPDEFTYITQVDVSSPQLKGKFAKPKEKIQADADLEFQVFNTAEKDWALRTVKAIEEPNTVLFEYAGELLLTVPDSDEDDYICSFFHKDGTRYFLDANKKGNLARFCNHSCEPNCIAQMVVDENEGGLPRVLIRTQRPIKQNEELTLDYGRKWWKAKSELDCECGSTECKYTGIPGEDIRLQFGQYRSTQMATKCASSRAPMKMTACKAARRGPPMGSYMMSAFRGGRMKQLASKCAGGLAPRKMLASKGCGGYRSMAIAARNIGHPTMKVEGGGEEEEDDDQTDEDEEEEEMDEDELDEEEDEMEKDENETEEGGNAKIEEK